jgi:hypothetical protein
MRAMLVSSGGDGVMRRQQKTVNPAVGHSTDLKPTPNRSAPKASGRQAPAAGQRRYADFVISAVRSDARRIQVAVPASPAGRMKQPVTTTLAEKEAKAIRDSFRSGAGSSAGRMLIKQAEATELGKRLSQALLPPAVFDLLERSLASVARDDAGGLRIRLALDAGLIDLPWEYLYRPDRAGHEGVSGFLLFDPAISLVRLKPRRRQRPTPAAGPQRLNFVGTFWEGRVDGWEVWREFDQLRRGLKPVAKFVQPEFAVASDLDVFAAGIEHDTAIFHYAGHVDFDTQGRAFCVREMPQSGVLAAGHKILMTDVAKTLRRTQTRLAVMSACNSGFWPAVEPLVDAGVDMVVGINGAVASVSTIEFCTRLYEALALGLGIDEAVSLARRASMEWGARNDLFDWGLYMVYVQTDSPVLFPLQASAAVVTRQRAVRRAHAADVRRSVERVRELDGLNFGEIMSQLIARRVLILGRFSARRLPVLEAIKRRLAAHANGYLPELFTFTRPDSRDLVESITGFANMSRFVIADLSEPRSIPQELQAIVPGLPSVPVIPIINEGGREFATFSALARRPNVVQPTLRYKNIEDLAQKLETTIVPKAEALLKQLKPAS